MQVKKTKTLVSICNEIFFSGLRKFGDHFWDSSFQPWETLKEAISKSTSYLYCMGSLWLCCAMYWTLFRWRLSGDSLHLISNLKVYFWCFKGTYLKWDCLRYFRIFVTGDAHQLCPLKEKQLGVLSRKWGSPCVQMGKIASSKFFELRGKKTLTFTFLPESLSVVQKADHTLQFEWPPARSFHRRILPNTKLQSTSFCADALSWFLLKGAG